MGSSFDDETGRLLHERERLHAEMGALERQLLARAGLGESPPPVSPYSSPRRAPRSPAGWIDRHAVVAPPPPVTPPPPRHWAPVGPRAVVTSPQRAEALEAGPRPVVPYSPRRGALSPTIAGSGARAGAGDDAPPRALAHWSPRFSAAHWSPQMAAAYEAAVTASERKRLYDAYYHRYQYPYYYVSGGGGSPVPRVPSPAPVSPYRAPTRSSPLGLSVMPLASGHVVVDTHMFEPVSPPPRPAPPSSVRHYSTPTRTHY